MNININLYLLIILFTTFLSCRQNPYAQGERIYEKYCLNCHMEDGQGFRLLYPPLAESDYLLQNFEKLPCIIRYGIISPTIVNDQRFDLPMLGIKELNEVEITNLINYINFRWEYQDTQIKISDVQESLNNCDPLKNQPGIAN